MLCHVFWNQVEYKIVCFITCFTFRLARILNQILGYSIFNPYRGMEGNFINLLLGWNSRVVIPKMAHRKTIFQV